MNEQAVDQRSRDSRPFLISRRVRMGTNGGSRDEGDVFTRADRGLLQLHASTPAGTGAVLMKETAIIMTPENGQKCFDGPKTQTRRIVNWLDCHSRSDGAKRRVFLERDVKEMNRLLTERQRSPLKQCCPYGQIMDRLWIREACWVWGMWASTFSERKKRQVYAFVESGSKQATFSTPEHSIVSKKQTGVVGWVRRPGIFMPRWACRTVVEIASIRVERVQEISEEDEMAEGITYHNGLGIGHSGYRYSSYGHVYATSRTAFRALWESINGPGSWARNDYVWVIGFRKIAP